MKSPVRPLLLAAATLAAASSAHAATQDWNTGGPTNNWNTTDTNWTGATAWTNGNDATFGGAGEAITINTTGITAHNLTFGVGGYSIGSSAPTNTLTLTGTTPTIEVTNGSDTATISSILAGTAGLTKTGAGTLVLNANNTFTGETVISENSGKVTLGELGFLRTTSGITIGTGSTLEIKATSGLATSRDKLFSATNLGTLVINGTLSNTGTLENRLNYASSITMNNGTILCNGGETVWGSFLFSASGTIAANGASNTISGTGNGIGISAGTLTFDTALATDALAVSAKLGATSAVAGAVQKTGLGTVTMSGANTYTGGLTVAGGMLNYTGAGTVLAGGALQIDSGATLKLSGTNINQLETTGVLTIAGTLEVAAARANTLRGTSVILNGGTMTSTGGTVSTEHGAFFAANNTTITANGTGNTISGNGDFGIADARTLTLSTVLVGDNLTVSTSLKHVSGATGGSLTKTGLGTVTLSGTNTYIGVTTINAGTLLANNTTGSATGTGAVSVASGARLGGSGTVTGAVTVAGGVTGGTIRGGTGTVTTDALTIGGKVTLASGSIVELALGSGGAHSSLNFNGTGDVLTSGLVFSFLDLGATTGTYSGLITGVDTVANLTGWSIANDGWVGTFSQVGTNINLNLTAVPEPSTYGLIGAGALAAVAMVRRRRKHAGKVA